MRTIVIETIPHCEQRYPTVGDYFQERESSAMLITPGVERVRVSNMENPDFEFLVALHELVEWWCAARHGVHEDDITGFDELFEQMRRPGDLREPGDSMEAPYHREHVFATAIEKLVARQIGVDWETYGRAVEALDAPRVAPV